MFVVIIYMWDKQDQEVKDLGNFFSNPPSCNEENSKKIFDITSQSCSEEFSENYRVSFQNSSGNYNRLKTGNFYFLGINTSKADEDYVKFYNDNIGADTFTQIEYDSSYGNDYENVNNPINNEEDGNTEDENENLNLIVDNGDFEIIPSNPPNNENFESPTIQNKINYCKNKVNTFNNLLSDGEFCDSDPSCLYNPYVLNQISNSINEDVSKDIYNRGENSAYLSPYSCVPVISIKKCFDYKSKSLCGENPIGKSQQSSLNLKNGCEWIPNTNNTIDSKLGICISKNDFLSPEKKDLNRYYFQQRKNPILNPSFEEDKTSWNNVGTISFDKHSFSKALKLREREILIQSFEFLTINKDYYFSLYVKKKNDNQKINLSFNLIQKDKNNVEIINKFSKLTTEEHKNFYKKYYFGPININEDSSNFTLEFSTDKEILIDTLSLSYNEEKQIETPVTIFKDDSFNCDVCKDSRNIDLCKNNYKNFGYCEYIENNTRKAKSIRDLTCNSYKEETQCENRNNLLNQFYGNLFLEKDKICSWSSINNFCFKNVVGDSNDNFTDYKILGGNNLKLLDVRGVYSNIENQKDTIIKTDCDLIPPTSYLFLSALDKNGERVYLDENSDLSNKIYGNIKVFLEAKEISDLSNCEINTELISKFKIGNEEFIFQNKNNEYYNKKTNFFSINNYPFNETFTDESGNSLVKNISDKRNFEIFFTDKSNNLIEGNKYKFEDFEFDLLGVQIGEDYLQSDLGLLSKSNSKEILLSDETEIKECKYKIYSEQTIYDYNSSWQNIEIENSVSQNFQFTISNLISNTSNNGDIYNVEFYCEDIFKQPSTKTFTFKAILNLNLIINEPTNFPFGVNLIGDKSSYIGGNYIPFKAYSILDIKSCFITFGDSKIDDLTYTNYGSGTEINGITFKSEIFLNLTKFNFDEEGIKNGEISCIDSEEITHTRDLSYYYLGNSFSVPENYNLFDCYNGGNLNIKKVEYNGKDIYYIVSKKSNPTGRLDNLCIDLKNIGTKFIESTINNNNNGLEYFSNLLNVYIDGGNSGRIYNLKNNEFQSNPVMSNITIKEFTKNFLEDTATANKNTILVGKNLYKPTYEIELEDVRNRKEYKNITFLYDINRQPKLKFKNGILGPYIIENKNYIFSQNPNPTFTLDFGTSEFRNFNCNIISKDTTTEYNSKTTEKLNIQNGSEEIKFEDIKPNGFDLSEKKKGEVKLQFKCVDEFGTPIENYNEEYYLIYDTTPPNLKEIDIQNTFYFSKSKSPEVFQEAKTDINFNLGDTDEFGYICEYDLIPLSNYDYDYYIKNPNYDGKLKEIFFEDEDKIIKNKLFLSRVSNKIPDSTTTQILSRNQFNINNALKNNNTNEFKINFKAFCKDFSGKKSQEITKIITIKYTSGDIIDFNFDYDNNKAFSILKTNKNRNLEDYSIVLSTNKDFTTFDILSPINDENSDYRTFTLEEGIDLSTINNRQEYFAGIKYNEGGIQEYISDYIYIDGKSPKIKEFRIFDLDDKNILYSPESPIKISIIDEGPSKLKSLNLYRKNSKGIHDLLISNINKGEPILELNGNLFNITSEDIQLSLNKKELDLTFMIENLDYTSHTFILEVKDNRGNTIQKQLDFSLQEGIGIILLESENNFLNKYKSEYYTRVQKPTISFRTTELASCEVNGKETIKDNLFHNYTFENNLFENQEVFEFEIICQNEENNNSKKRNIEFLTAIPDFSLNINGGFSLILDEVEEEGIDFILKNTGLVDEITCDFKINNIASFDNYRGYNFSNYFRTTTFENFYVENLFQAGILSLSIKCRDKTGVETLEKNYILNITDGEKFLKIEKINLIKNNIYYNNYNKTFFLKNNNVNDYTIEIFTNRFYPDCNLEISENNKNEFTNFLNTITFNFFETAKSYPISFSSNSIIRFENVDFNYEKINNLKFSCKTLENSDYNVVVPEFKIENIEDIEFEIQ